MLDWLLRVLATLVVWFQALVWLAGLLAVLWVLDRLV